MQTQAAGAHTDHRWVSGLPRDGPTAFLRNLRSVPPTLGGTSWRCQSSARRHPHRPGLASLPSPPSHLEARCPAPSQTSGGVSMTSACATVPPSTVGLNAAHVLLSLLGLRPSPARTAQLQLPCRGNWVCPSDPPCGCWERRVPRALGISSIGDQLHVACQFLLQASAIVWPQDSLLRHPLLSESVFPLLPEKSVLVITGQGSSSQVWAPSD